ncbi:MAG: hypothetical protein AAFN70_13975, partial [Planctomycetota bacterium]
GMQRVLIVNIVTIFLHAVLPDIHALRGSSFTGVWTGVSSWGPSGTSKLSEESVGGNGSPQALSGYVVFSDKELNLKELNKAAAIYHRNEAGSGRLRKGQRVEYHQDAR